MIKFLFYCFLFLQVPNLLLAQIEVEAPMEDPDIPTQPEDLFSKFIKKGNNIFELPNAQVAESLIQKHKIQPLEDELLNDFFKVEAFLGKGDKALIYYPYSLIALNNNLHAYITLENRGDYWAYKAYTFDKDFNAIDEILLSKTNDNIKTQWNTDNTITFTHIKHTMTTALKGENQQLKSEFVYKVNCNAQGKFSEKILIAQKGLSIQTNSPQDKNDLYPEIYLTGNLLKTVEWSDKIGQHFALVSYANTNDEKSTNLVNAPITLYFYHYVKKAGDKKFDIVHQSKINVKACKLEVEHFFAGKEVFYFSDNDNNETLEVFIPYFMSCRADAVNQIPMQLLMWEGNREFFQLINIDIASKKAQYNFTSIWQRLSANIMKHANEIIEYCGENAKI